MITVARRAFYDATTPEEIFETLGDAERISNLMPRVEKVELYDRDNEQRTARLVMNMAMGGIFGTIRCEGSLTWVDNREIAFDVRTPLPVSTRWELIEGVNGTEVRAQMSLNLVPLLGPMASFVPEKTVSDMLAGDLEKVLKGLAKELRQRPNLLERQVAA
jgi:carbon monoxide dehydrogenase subunit G